MFLKNNFVKQFSKTVFVEQKNKKICLDVRFENSFVKTEKQKTCLEKTLLETVLKTKKQKSLFGYNIMNFDFELGFV